MTAINRQPDPANTMSEARARTPAASPHVQRQ
jgi:hypothetical protein